MAIPIDGSYPLTASFSTSAWQTRNVSAQTNEGSIQFTWSGLNTADSTIVVEGSDDATNYNELAKADGTSNKVTLVAASGSQIWEILQFNTKYIRMTYAHGTNSAGTGVVTSYTISRD